VDRLCDQFEAALRRGEAASIEQFLAGFPAAHRTELLRELVALEIDFRRARGETISFPHYFQRFPDAAKLLHEMQKVWNLQDSSGFIAVRDPVQMRDNVETVAYMPASPQRIRQFELLSVLGHGGFGAVWRARDTLLQREFAVKVPRKDRLFGMNMALFLREARAAAKLRHPNIVAIHEVGEEDSSAFIVSDFVDGMSLKAWLEIMHPTTTESAMLVAKLATAAQHAHERGIVHRDLKPANVLIDRLGEPHIADFGLAKRDTSEDSLAVSDQLVGTPAYMAPEQARGDHKAIDRRTDVYALGAILYEMLTGQRAFSGEIAMMLNQIQHVPPKAPRKIKPEIPRELEAICLKCLEKDPAKRYATAQELADDLHRHIAGQTLLGIPTPVPVRMQKWLYRHRRLMLPIAAIALVVAGLSVFLYSHLRPAIPSDLRQVQFKTMPHGCEITVVPIDPDTGEPDPTKIQQAIGVTQEPDRRDQLTMSLTPGDYLVIAVLKDDASRFHEVLRHVPRVGEEPIPGALWHQQWTGGRRRMASSVSSESGPSPFRRRMSPATWGSSRPPTPQSRLWNRIPPARRRRSGLFPPSSSISRNRRLSMAVSASRCSPSASACWSVRASGCPRPPNSMS
jgi:serine/threonine protein kinase